MLYVFNLRLIVSGKNSLRALKYKIGCTTHFVKLPKGLIKVKNSSLQYEKS